MEHLVGGLVFRLLRWLDRRFLKPLRRVVPNLDKLLSEPAEALQTEPVTIGGAARYFDLGTSVPTLVLLVVLWGIGFILAGTELIDWTTSLVLATVSLAFAPLAHVFFARRGARHIQMVLSIEGVELKRGRVAIHCPWALFAMPGQPIMDLETEELILPISPGAGDYVEARKEDRAVAQGWNVRSRQFAFRSRYEAVLEAFYEVDARELGWLLLHLGQTLAPPLPTELPAPIEVPREDVAQFQPLARDKHGWFTLSLTHLVLPPICCQCGAPTAATQRFWCEAVRYYGLSYEIKRAEIPVPVCLACQQASKRRIRRASIWGVGIGILATLLLVVGIAVFSQLGLEVAGLLYVPCLPLCFYVGRGISTHMAAPIHFKRYSPSKGTVKIRFRRAEYNDEVLAFANAVHGTETADD